MIVIFVLIVIVGCALLAALAVLKGHAVIEAARYRRSLDYKVWHQKGRVESARDYLQRCVNSKSPNREIYEENARRKLELEEAKLQTLEEEKQLKEFEEEMNN